MGPSKKSNRPVREKAFSSVKKKENDKNSPRRAQTPDFRSAVGDAITLHHLRIFRKAAFRISAMLGYFHQFYQKKNSAYSCDSNRGCSKNPQAA